MLLNLVCRYKSKGASLQLGPVQSCKPSITIGLHVKSIWISKGIVPYARDSRFSLSVLHSEGKRTRFFGHTGILDPSMADDEWAQAARDAEEADQIVSISILG